MEIKKTLLLSFLYIHSFISVLGSTTPKRSNYQQKRNDRHCVCVETKPHRKKISEILDPTSKGIERLVIFVYRTPDGTIYTYIPEMNKQSGLLPDFQYENGDILDINAEEPLETIFLNHKKLHDLRWFWNDQPIQHPQDKKTIINKNKPSKQYHQYPVKDTLKQKPYKSTQKHQVTLKDTPLNSVRKHRLFWKDSSDIIQNSGIETFNSKDSPDYEDWTENEHHFTNKPNSHKKLGSLQPFEMGYPPNSKSIHNPSKYPLKKDNVKKLKLKPNKNIIDKSYMPIRKIPDKSQKLNNYHIPYQGPKESVTYLPTESEEDEKIPPLFYFSDSDKDAYPFLFDSNNKNFRYIPEMNDKESQPFDQHSRYTPLKKGSNHIFDRVKPKYIPGLSEETDDLFQKEPYNIESLETSFVPKVFNRKLNDVHKYPNSLNSEYIPEKNDEEQQLFDPHSQYPQLKQARKRAKPNRVKPKFISIPSEESYDLFQKELHSKESSESFFNPHKHRPKASKNELNMFIIDEDMIDNHWKKNIREHFGPISLTQRGPGESFDEWFLKQIKNNDLGISLKQPIEYKALQHFVEVALKRHGMFVSPKGDLIDSNGNSMDMGNINLRRLLIGDSLEYYKLRENPDGTFRFPQNSPYMESLLIALLNPPKIIGIIPLGKVKLPGPLDFTSVPKRPKQYTTSVEHKEVEDVLDISHSNKINNKLFNEQKSMNSKNEFSMANPKNQSFRKSTESESLDEKDLQQTILDIFNDSVPISESKYSHGFTTDTNTKHHLPNIAKSAPKISNESSPEQPIQKVLSLLNEIVDKTKDEILPPILNTKNKPHESVGMSFKEKKLHQPLVKHPSAASVQSSQNQKMIRKEKSNANNTLDKNKKPNKGKLKNFFAHYEKPKKDAVKQNTAVHIAKTQTKNAKPKPTLISTENEELEKEVTKTNKNIKKKKKLSLIPRVIQNIHDTVVGGETVDDIDHDFRIIGGLAATGSGRPINNRGRSGDKDTNLY